ncbi:MAG: hypothetical protein ABSH39_04140 [Candidatus Acidiferrum sp.]|jgi:hypothetical protein
MSIELFKSKSRTSAVSGGIEVVGFPQLLFTREFGDPDTLLIPLLDAAHEALESTRSLPPGNSGNGQGGMMSAIYLATSFMKDNHFTLAPLGCQPQTRYVLDLDAESIHVRTWLYATVGKRTSTFLVTVAGNLKTGMYVVRTGKEDSVVAEFDEKRLRTPGFFSTVLPEECLQLQMSMDHFKRFGNLPVAETEDGVRISVPTAGSKIPILLRKKEGPNTWEVLDGRTSNRIIALPPEAAVHLDLLLKALPKLLEK